MSPLDMGLEVGVVGMAGVALALALGLARQRREARKADRSAQRLWQTHASTREDLARLREQVAELGYVLVDGRRRWGFDLESRWPDVAALVAELDPQTASRFLIEWAPGIGGLRDGGRATDRVA